MTDGSRCRRLADWVLLHPVATVVAAAFVVRTLVAAVLNVTDTWSLAPDAGSYLAVAEAVSSGRLDSFWPGYGPSLFNSTRSFSAQVAFLFDVFGPYRISGQLVAVLYGSLAAGLTVLLARRLIRPSFALAAGLVVALSPSQVLWSSVVLRESTIWVLLVGIAVILGNLSRTSTPRTIFITTLGVAMAYLGLEFLRGQTAFLALWSGTLALLIGGIGSRNRRARVVAAVALLLVAPLAANHQPAAVDFLLRATERLGTVRTYMAMGAESAIYDSATGSASRSDDGVGEDLVAAGSTNGTGSSGMEVSDGSSKSLAEEPSGGLAGGEGADSSEAATGQGMSREAGIDGSADSERLETKVSVGNEVDVLQREPAVVDGQKFVVDIYGNTVPVYNDLEANFRAFPGGLVAVAVRPFPWEPGQTGKRLAGSIESVFWVPLFLLAAVGVWYRRRELGVVAFPVTFSLVYLVSAAVTQGNLGTAFRHRGQILFAVAVLALAGVQVLWDRRESRNVQPS